MCFSLQRERRYAADFGLIKLKLLFGKIIKQLQSFKLAI